MIKILIFCLFLATTFAAEVTRLHGTASANTKSLKLGDKIIQGDQIETEEKSFVQITLADKSQIHLGPSARMKLERLPEKQAAMLNLLQGQLRATVTKSSTSVDKLYVRTKNAAMGVRGTQFQINYTPANQATVLVTFEGQVAMAIGNDIAADKIASTLQQEGHLVTGGQYFAKGQEAVLPAPIKISPLQLERLKNQGPTLNNTPRFYNPVPPGVDPKNFANQGQELAKHFGETTHLAVSVKEPDIRPGGLIDLQTGKYQEPRRGSVFDPNTQTYSDTNATVIIGTNDSQEKNEKNSEIWLPPPNHPSDTKPPSLTPKDFSKVRFIFHSS